MYDSKPGPTFPVTIGEWEPTAELRVNTVTYKKRKDSWLQSDIVRSHLQQRWRRDMGDGFEYDWRPIPKIETEKEYDDR